MSEIVEVKEREIKEFKSLILYKDFYMERRVLSTQSHLPTLNKDVEIEMHLIKSLFKETNNSDKDRAYQMVNEYKDNTPLHEFSERVELGSEEIELITEEIKKYCGLDFFNTKDNTSKAYLFSKVYEVVDNKRIELPLFMSCMNYYPEIIYCDENIVPDRWMSRIMKGLDSAVYHQLINSFYIEDLMSFQFNLSPLLYGFFELLEITPDNNIKDKYDKAVLTIINKVQGLLYGNEIEMDKENPELNVRPISEMSEDCLKIYFTDCINSFIDYIKEKNIVKQCQNCDNLFTYKEDKKYCSTKCLKTSANKRNYQKRKLKSSSEVAVK